MTYQEKKDISKFIQKTVKKWNGDAEFINEWDCEEFAKTIIDSFPEAKLYWNDELPHLFNRLPNFPIHSFVLYKGKYYDAECPSGVINPSFLPRFKRINYIK